MAEEYYLQEPRKQRFYKILATVMHYLALGDKTWWGYSKPNKFFVFHNYIVLSFSPALLFTQLMYLYVNFDDLTFDTLGIILSIVPVACLANVNVYSARLTSYKTIMKEFMSKIHLINEYKNNDEYIKKKVIEVERITRWTAYYLMFFFSMNWVAWIWIPIVNNINNKDLIQNRTMRLQTCVYMWFPFDYGFNYRNWLCVHSINIYVDACGVTVMMIFHIINYTFMFHLIGHIQILKYKLETEFNERLTDREAKDKLVAVIKHHAFITRIFSNVQSAFGINVTTNYLHNLVGDSLIMYQIMYGGKQNIILYMVMVTVYIGNLIMMSFVLEEMRRQTEDLADVVYSMPWENMSVSNQKTFILLLQRVQPALEFVAMGGLRAGVRPMISIIKTTFSYYVMLETSMAGKS
ncbi:uncharacterized protein LOC123693648 [Colias croceus]|uniref:uncharacterized protein LOC123693648 n=1 Tax=Colias crocea TaxID=72248 RepID=UPI001E27C85F|nr:uncharacterized protein LOC123693648 [Colias croceus]